MAAPKPEVTTARTQLMESLGFPPDGIAGITPTGFRVLLSNPTAMEALSNYGGATSFQVGDPTAYVDFHPEHRAAADHACRADFEATHGVPLP